MAVPGRFVLAVVAGRAVIGGAMLVRPRGRLDAFGASAGSTSSGVCRVLGARHLLQAAVTAAAPTPVVLAAGAATDALHCASLVGALCSAPLVARWRAAVVPLGVSAAVSALWAVAGTACVRAALRPLARG